MSAVTAGRREKTCGWPTLWRPIPGAVPFCPGCQEPVAGRILCEVIEELGIAGRAIGSVGVGCSGFMMVTLDIDCINGAHGRGPDIATGIKRSRPEAVVFTLQGDGDCLAIGAEPFLNAMFRAENITVVMLNNATYGTTGGQMAPTTLVRQVTTTTPGGRNVNGQGYPAHAAELASTLKGVSFSARGALATTAQYRQSKEYVRLAFQRQMSGPGLSFVEIICACPTDWRLGPVDSLLKIMDEMVPEFPLGIFKDVGAPAG